MKKSISVNIDSHIFYMDEDAFEKLDLYLCQLRTIFTGPEGREVVSDIESRIGEILAERCPGEKHIVNIQHVNEVICRVGSPSELQTEFSDKSNQQNSQNTPPPFNGYSQQQSYGNNLQYSEKKLFRDEQDKVMGGVISGLSCYMGWNVKILRISVALIAIFTSIIPMFVAYICAWALIPPAKTPAERLAMCGIPVTPETIAEAMTSKTFLNPSSNEVAHSVGRVLLAILMVFLGSISLLISFTLVIIFIYTSLGLTLFNVGGLPSYFDDTAWASTHPIAGMICVLLISLAIIIISILVIWMACSVLFKIKAPSSSTMWKFAIAEVVCIVAIIIVKITNKLYIY